MIEVEEYLREDNTSPYQSWFAKLNAQAAVKVATAILRLELGNTSAIKWFSGLGELRIDWGPGYRVYLLKDGETLIVLFGGGTKSTQSKDIDKAKALISEYKQRKKTTRYIQSRKTQK
jgi:putative addiction module killer protein